MRTISAALVLVSLLVGQISTVLANNAAHVTRSELTRILVEESGRNILKTEAMTRISFWDVGRGHPDFLFIETLARSGDVKGFFDGTFRPDELITRAQLLTLTKNVFGISESFEHSFDDVSDDDWYADSVGWFELLGLYAGPTLDPGAHVTLEEVLNVISTTKTRLPELEKKREERKKIIEKATEEEVLQNVPEKEESTHNPISGVDISSSSFSVTIQGSIDASIVALGQLDVLYLDAFRRPIAQKNIRISESGSFSHTQVVAKKSRPITAVLRYSSGESLYILEYFHESKN